MKIRQSYKLFASNIFLLLIILGFFVFKALNSRNDVIRSEEHRFRSVMLAIELFQSSEDLTRMARSYVSTGNPIYKNKYFEILDIRNGKRPRPQKYNITYWHLAGEGKGEAVAPGKTVALQDLMQNEGYTEEEFNLLRECQTNSDYLVNMEKQAFAALNGLYNDGRGNFTVHRTPDRNYAIQLLFSEEYSNEKAKIMAPIQQFMDVIDQRTKNELSIDQSKLQQYILFALVFIIIVMIVVLIKIIHTFRRILYPIERLRTQVAEIASGNYAARCDILSSNEIGELCSNFNSMANSLETDFTERKKAEEALHESEEKFRAIFENNSSALAIIEKDTTISMVNREYCKMGGYEEKDVIGTSWTKQIPPEDLERLKEYNRKRLIDPKSAPNHYEFLFYRKDGEVRNSLMSVAIIPTNQKIVCSFTDITDRKRSEEALRQSEAKFRKLLESTTFPIAYINRDGMIAFRNEKFIKVFGYTEVEVPTISEWWSNAYPDIEYRKLAIKNWELEVRRAAETSTDIKSEEYRITCKDGSIREMIISGIIINNNFLVSFFDITERKQSEEKLRETRNYLDSLFKYANAPIIVWDKEFKITRFNKAFELITGRDAKDVIGKHIELLFPDEMKKQSMEYISRTVSGEKLETVEIPIKHADGTISTLLWNSANIYGTDGKTLISTIAQGHNITIRKQATEALRKSSEMVKLLLNSTAEAIYGLDMKGNCTFNNAACLKILGYEQPEELLGKNMHEMIHSKYADGTPYNIYDCPIFNAFRSEKEIHIDNEVIWRKDGTSFPAEYWSYPVRQDGKLIGAVVTFLDITERKQFELEREKLIKELQFAIDNIKTLQGLIPICANCKKIRDDKGYWNQVEGYIMEHSDATFTHGVCPDCAKKLYGDLYEKAIKKPK
jgi:PAS domain S-box-containing protein